jgi:ATPase subunit of ABC transporter with duplicated ATPase domains
MDVKDLRFAWPGGPEVLKDVSFVLKREARLAIRGANGAGKTTLLHCLYQGAPEIWETPGIVRGYYRQDLSILDPNKTLLENVMDGAVVPAQTVRAMLARVLLPEGSVQKKAAVLSGGERAKAALVKLLAGDANLLLLDEPTNFLDVYALEGLESMIGQYPGTIVLVSHDRYFVDKVSTDALTLTGGRLEEDAPRPATPVPAPSDAEITALRLRRDMLLSRISTMKAGEERGRLEKEFEELNERLSRL